MGKEIATVDSSGAVAVSKKRVISTGVQTFTEDGLLIPKRTFEDVKKQVAVATKTVHTVLWTLFPVGLVSIAGSFVGGFITGNDFLLFGVFGGMLISFAPLFSLDKLTPIKKAHAVQLDKWLYKRYGINIDWTTASAEVFGIIVLDSLAKGQTVRFKATNGNEYILNQTTEGALFVQPVAYNLPKPEQVREIEASTNPYEANTPHGVVLDETVQQMLDTVKADVNTLRTYDLPAEQEHEVNRAMDEANRAVSTFAKIRKLQPEADNIDTVDVLSLVSRELTDIKNTIVESLRMDLRSVNSHRA